MDSSNPTIGEDIRKLKAKVLELELELSVIETGWFKRRQLRKQLKKVLAEIDYHEKKL